MAKLLPIGIRQALLSHSNQDILLAAAWLIRSKVKAGTLRDEFLAISETIEQIAR